MTKGGECSGWQREGNARDDKGRGMLGMTKGGECSRDDKNGGWLLAIGYWWGTGEKELLMPPRLPSPTDHSKQKQQLRHFIHCSVDIAG